MATDQSAYGTADRTANRTPFKSADKQPNFTTYYGANITALRTTDKAAYLSTDD